MTDWKMDGAGSTALRSLADALGVADGVSVTVSDRVMDKMAHVDPTLALGFTRTDTRSAGPLTAGQVALAMMLGRRVTMEGLTVTKVVLDPGSIERGIEPLVMIYDDDGDLDAYSVTEVVEGATIVMGERV